MKRNVDYTLYLVTDRRLSTKPLEEAVADAIRGGVTLVQLREKEGDSGELYRRAVAMKKVTDAFGVPLVIDDRVDVMIAAGADGVHVGQSDLPAEKVRAIVGPDKILGVSAGTVAEAVKAEQDGADYIGTGAMFPTATKTDADLTSMAELTRICHAVSIPVVAIGGLRPDRMPLFQGTGIAGAAVVSAIIAAKDIRRAAEEMKKAVERIKM